jgi:hypothetical protein
VGVLDRFWGAINEILFSDPRGSGADIEGARKRAHTIASVGGKPSSGVKPVPWLPLGPGIADANGQIYNKYAMI